MCITSNENFLHSADTALVQFLATAIVDSFSRIIFFPNFTFASLIIKRVNN